jgi:hypothetical protein
VITPAQLRMLKDCADGEPTDYSDYFLRSGSSALGWYNREQVISALIRKKLLDDDLKPTVAGRALL